MLQATEVICSKFCPNFEVYMYKVSMYMCISQELLLSFCLHCKSHVLSTTKGHLGAKNDVQDLAETRLGTLSKY